MALFTSSMRRSSGLSWSKNALKHSAPAIAAVLTFSTCLRSDASAGVPPNSMPRLSLIVMLTVFDAGSSAGTAAMSGKSSSKSAGFTGWVVPLGAGRLTGGCPSAVRGPARFVALPAHHSVYSIITATTCAKPMETCALTSGSGGLGVLACSGLAHCFSKGTQAAEAVSQPSVCALQKPHNNTIYMSDSASVEAGSPHHTPHR